MDYEKIKEYKFDIEATDPTVNMRFFKSGGPKSIAAITIEILDVDEPPIFSQPSYVYKIKENYLPKNPLGTVLAVDPDAAKRKIR